MQLDPDLSPLVELFHAPAERLGRCTAVNVEQVPEPYRGLLAHEHHMTVTVEAFHRSPVVVRVLAARRVEEQYQRQILLLRQTDQAVVQYGIVRLDLRQIPAAARDDILGEQIPLGRVLIQHDVLRSVHLSRLWRIECGPDLQQFFGVPAGSLTFGRTAAILTDGQPAIELLEIIAPIGNVIA